MTEAPAAGLYQVSDHHEDADLVRVARDGDVEAYARLVDRYYARCLRYAMRMLGVREDAEEVVQDTFMRAYRGLADYQHRGRFEAWLLRILVNRCRTRAVKKQRERRTFVASEDLSHPPDPVVTPSDPLRMRDVRAALMALPDAHREAFLLKHVEELSYAEMAAVTGDRVPALKMRVKRAREQLQRLLREVRDEEA